MRQLSELLYSTAKRKLSKAACSLLAVLSKASSFLCTENDSRVDKASVELLKGGRINVILQKQAGHGNLMEICK